MLYLIYKPTSVFCSVVNINVADADHTSQVHSPFGRVFAVIRDGALTPIRSTISVSTVHRVCSFIFVNVRPRILFPRRFQQCQILYIIQLYLYLMLNLKSEKNGKQKVHGSDQSMKLGVSISYGNTKPCQLIRAVIIKFMCYFSLL